MPKKHTIAVAPRKGEGLRMRVTNRQLLGICAGVISVLALATFATWSFFTSEVSLAELDRLRAENEALRSVNIEFEGGIRDLQGRLQEYEDRTEKLAIVAGLNLEEGSNEPGIGGASEPAVRIEGLDHRASRLSARLDLVEAELEKRSARFSSTPSVAPARGLLTSRYGYRTDPLSGDRSFHRGIDIGTGPKRPVHATADGVVTLAGRKGALGTAIYLSHGFGMTTRYGHLSRVIVERGERVEQGDLIGYVGNSGRATGYHLHYEVLVDGRTVNPLAYILDDLTGP